MKNLFKNASFVGNERVDLKADAHVDKDRELEERVQYLEQEVAAGVVNNNNVDSGKAAEDGRNEKRWEKFKTFFTSVVKPILVFIPKFLNAVTMLYKVRAMVQGV